MVLEQSRTALLTVLFWHGPEWNSTVYTIIENCLECSEPFWHASVNGVLGELSPIHRIVFVMMTSPVLCTRSIVVAVMPAMLVKWGGTQDLYVGAPRAVKMTSLLAQYALEYDHHIDCTSMCVFGSLTLTGWLSRICDKQNNSYWTVRNYEILSRYSEIIITTF